MSPVFVPPMVAVGALLPLLATRILEQIGSEAGFTALELDMDAKGEFLPKFSAGGKSAPA